MRMEKDRGNEQLIRENSQRPLPSLISMCQTVGDRKQFFFRDAGKSIRGGAAKGLPAREKRPGKSRNRTLLETDLKPEAFPNMRSSLGTGGRPEAPVAEGVPSASPTGEPTGLVPWGPGAKGDFQRRVESHKRKCLP